ncbi:hypothetical protein SAMN02927937_00872 [Paenimyroides aquimaris]|uniref:Uncharacterized protein n=1 Tax=Paenimyroides marinum TaxID=1159016 RepID=A0A1H6K9V0_9FLAO|nr:hypothetical protein [Paenimyroides aquimaris]SEH68578.1 hypothetical protein SAMN02927937_00872 [Paenimyroides aquimaris]
MNELEILYKIKNSIIASNDEKTLIDLEVNLKHYINLKSYVVENTEEYSELEIKNIKNVISIGTAYQKIINWKKYNIQLDKRVAAINSLANSKKELFDIFETTKQTILSNYYDFEKLKAENAILRSELAKLNQQKDVFLNQQKELSDLPIGVHPNKMHRLKEVKDLKKIRRKIEKMSEELFSYLDEKIQKNEL